MSFDLEELAAIIEQLDRTEFTDFRFEHGDLRLRVRRDGGSAELEETTAPAPSGTAASAPTPAPAASGTEAAPAAQPPAAPAPAAPPATPAGTTAQGSGALDPQALPEGYVAVKAPMLGTYYGAPKPGAAPFVNVGDVVGPESTLCIIEVMKLMNSVTAGVSGEVAAVFLSDGDLAEFEQPLFAVKVAS